MAPNAAAISAALRKRKKAGPTAAEVEERKSVQERTRFDWIATALRQKQVRDAYRNPKVQWSIALCIMGNFFTNIVEKEIDPWNENYPDFWPQIEFAWNCVFVVELLWNMYGSFFLSTLKNHFFCSAWNLFDLLVVGVSIPTMTGADLGSFSQMRMLRAFRVFRLFKRIKSLNKIITSLGRAVSALPLPSDDPPILCRS